MIELLPLSDAEREFLARGPAARRLPSPHLTRALAARLAARLGMPLDVRGTAATDAPERVDVPRWQRDARLDSLWLTRRLGGRQTRGLPVPEQPGLTRMLDQTLAEYLLDGVEDFEPASQSNWRVRWDDLDVDLALTLPSERASLQRWAVGVIRDAR
ncbi:MAG: hypothetical protein MUF16_25995 [Burkholderiaceae bacterium]|jgi:hypothetical protein|nr:hypothetical protein [Burkholderiaceae bacterium]